MLDVNSYVPLYVQLMEDLICKIDDEEIKVGQQLPSERELCSIYKMSRTTVRQAIVKLLAMGYVENRRGVGNFVIAKTNNHRLDNAYSFTEEMLRKGNIPTTNVLSIEIMTPNETIINLFNETRFYEIKRIRICNDEEIMIETSYIPCKYLKDLDHKVLQERGLYYLLALNYNTVITRAIESFKVRMIDEESARILNASINSPVMQIQRQGFNNDVLIEYTTSVALGSKYEYTVDLSNKSI